MTVGIIGLGLIGGSIAKAIRKKFPDTRIIAYNRNQEVLKQAEEEGVISEGVPFVSIDFSECDTIFLCTPVVTSLSYLDILKDVMRYWWWHAVSFFKDFRYFPFQKSFPEIDLRSDGTFSSRLHQAFPAAVVLPLKEQNLDLAGGSRTDSVQTRGDDLRVVDDEGISFF